MKRKLQTPTALYKLGMADDASYRKTYLGPDMTDEMVERFTRLGLEEFDLSWNWTPRRLASNWPEIRVKMCGKLPNDFPTFSTGIPMFSERAVEALRDLLEPSGELLPVITDKGLIYVLNITTVVEALDMDRSELSWTATDADWASNVWVFEFDPDRLTNAPIFRLRECPNWWCVSDVVLNRALAAGLKGMAFYKIWPDVTNSRSLKDAIQLR